MKEHNKKLIIIVSVLVLVIGVSFAYFVATVLLGGEGSKIKASTASINGATINVRGILEFDTTDLEMYPGHKTVSGIELTATGDGEFIPYNLVWQGTNTLNTPLEFTVYKSEVEKDVNATCNKTTKIEAGSQILYEECNITNIDTLGSPIYNGTINKEQEKVTLSNAEFITATSTGNKVYYYVVLEYPNLNKEQNEDMGGRFTGKVTVEENNSSADITIANIYKEENGEYNQVANVPNKDEKYKLNTEKSTCSNNAEPTWNKETWSLQVSSLTTSGTECNLYFEQEKDNLILANAKKEVKTEIPDFSQVATVDEGVYAVEDGMHGETSYYWRGAVTNNYVKFANKCWRIIRINGDGSIRLIYDGTTCHANGESTSDSIAVTSQAYNSNYNRSEYVGWTYSTGSQRTTSGTASNIKSQTDSWYSTNIKGTDAEKVADGKFCNDRNTASGYSWSSQPSSTFYYAGYGRLQSAKTPTLSCPEGDVYTLKAGAITMDEVVMAGGVYGTANSSYYLYNGQYYWTMSPYYWNGSCAYVFFVSNDGGLSHDNVNDADGVRPVINLKADTTFATGGNGTQNNPYVVS